MQQNLVGFLILMLIMPWAGAVDVLVLDDPSQVLDEINWEEIPCGEDIQALINSAHPENEIVDTIQRCTDNGDFVCAGIKLGKKQIKYGLWDGSTSSGVSRTLLILPAGGESTSDPAQGSIKWGLHVDYADGGAKWWNGLNDVWSDKATSPPGTELLGIIYLHVHGGMNPCPDNL